MTDLHPDLRDWIEKSTKDLAPEPRERVVEDILRHYEEVREDRLNEGDSDRDADWQALKSLGDAKRARKRFHKTYLTERDMRWVDQITRVPEPSLELPTKMQIRVILIVFAALAAPVILAIHWYPPQSLSFEWIVYPGIVLSAIFFAVAVSVIPLFGRTRSNRMVLGAFASSAYFSIAVLSHGSLRVLIGRSFECPSLLIYSLLGLYLFHRQYRISKKLRDWDGQ